MIMIMQEEEKWIMIQKRIDKLQTIELEWISQKVEFIITNPIM